MTVNLHTVGDTHLGKSGDVKLSELNSSDATTRVYSVYGYKRVNSGEVARGEAPSPAASGTGTLTDWMSGGGNAYQQWIASDEVGTNMNLAAAPTAASGPEAGVASFSFTVPSGYANFHQGSVRQQLFIKECSSQASSCDEDPITGDPRVNVNGTATTLTTGQELDEETWYCGTVRMQWNDEKTPTGSVYTRSSDGYTCAGSMAHGGTANTNRITFYMPSAPVCTADWVALSTTSGNAGACDAWCTYDLHGGGNTLININHSVCCSSGRTLYTNGNNCQTTISSSYKWATPDGDTAWSLSSNGYLNGTTYNIQANCNPLDC